jgi:hypothetical protein
LERIFSARLDEAALDEMERVTRRLKMTKRKFLEEAIHLRARQLDGGGADVWSETLGAWKRKERPETTIRRARREFRQSFARHRREEHARIRR